MFVFVTREQSINLINTFNPEKTGVLLSAVNKYKNPSWNLSGPVNDAADIEQVLKKNYHIPEKNIIKLYNSEATKKNILEKANYIVNNYPEVIFAWSGHGTQVPCYDEDDYKEECIVTWDHDWNNVLMGDDIYAVFSKAKRAVIILDCCHAQGASRDGSIIKSISPPIGFKLQRKKSKKIDYVKDNIIEIAACLSNELAYEEPIGGRGRGLLSYYLCRILEQKLNISPVELQYELRKRISKQNPSISPLTENPIFKIAA